MRYRMRRLASVLTALTVLVGLPVAGGAWLSSSNVTSSESTVITFAAAASAEIAPVVATDGPGAYPTMPQVPEPDSGSVIDWLCTVDEGHERCRPVQVTAAAPAAAGSETASPRSTATAPPAPYLAAGRLVEYPD